MSGSKWRNTLPATPANAGVQGSRGGPRAQDSRFRGNDDVSRDSFRAGLLARPYRIGSAREDEDQRSLDFLLLWSIIEAAARHRLSSLKVPPISRISSSALLKMLVSGGIVEDDDYAVLRRVLAARNAIAHGFLNQMVDGALFEKIRSAAKDLLGTRNRQ